jgi:hypothetical protein
VYSLVNWYIFPVLVCHIQKNLATLLVPVKKQQQKRYFVTLASGRNLQGEAAVRTGLRREGCVPAGIDVTKTPLRPQKFSDKFLSLNCG